MVEARERIREGLIRPYFQSLIFFPHSFTISLLLTHNNSGTITMKMINLALICAISLIISGCASIAGDNTRTVKVDSFPSGAGIYVDNQQYGVTPAVITLPTYIYGGKAVTLRKKGYQDQTMVVNTKFQPIALLDILFWPTLLVDAGTGSLVKIDPANLNLNAKLERA